MTLSVSRNEGEQNEVSPLTHFVADRRVERTKMADARQEFHGEFVAAENKSTEVKSVNVNESSVTSNEQRTIANSPRSTQVIRPRFGNSGVSEFAVRKLSEFLAEKTRGDSRVVCPRGPGCDPLRCSQAFLCGALPQKSSGLWFILFWTLGAGLAAIAFLIVGVAVVLVSDGDNSEPIQWAQIALVFVGFPLAFALIGFMGSFVFSRYQQQHVRSLAIAAQQCGLTFTGLLSVPMQTCGHAFPVLYPGAPFQGGQPFGCDVTVDLAMTGKVQGHTLHVGRFEFRYDPLNFVPLGTALKVASGIIQPKLLLSRETQKQWLGYLVVVFADSLPNVPDFLLTPRSEIQARFQQYSMPGNIVPLPSSGHLAEYCFAVADVANVRWFEGAPLQLLASERGWSVQVVGGRLMVWRGVYYPGFRHTLPSSADKIAELVRFADEVRRVLVHHGLVR